MDGDLLTTLQGQICLAQLHREGRYRHSTYNTEWPRLNWTTGRWRQHWWDKWLCVQGSVGCGWRMVILLQTGLIDLISAGNPLACLRSPRPAAVIPVTFAGVDIPTESHSVRYFPCPLMFKSFWSDTWFKPSYGADSCFPDWPPNEKGGRVDVCVSSLLSVMGLVMQVTGY